MAPNVGATKEKGLSSVMLVLCLHLFYLGGGNGNDFFFYFVLR